ncbi:MAG: phenylacetate-CoA oxygenase subunit PaaC [Chitinophagaceae bacterium]|nr:phenylacetate-CoA oxygenase subunit PaaC [Chitinophagaceae bacterium]
MNYTLSQADTTLILGHRNSEWCGHGPVLEQDIAITNISLDLIGQARNFYQYAAELINHTGGLTKMGSVATEDTLAYLRDASEFRNCILVELPKGDWAHTILRQFFFSAYQFFLYKKLELGCDEQLAAIATKSLKEVVYHLRWSSEWVIRLGDGTDESHSRMVDAAQGLWSYTDELFIPSIEEAWASEQGIASDVSTLKDEWLVKVKEIFADAHLEIPGNTKVQAGGKEGSHTEHLESILSEMQHMQRTYPGCEW